MTESNQKLKRDLAILEVMIENMTDYLSVDPLFYPLPHPGYPYLTLGGYWLREERLSALSYMLNPLQKNQLQTIQTEFKGISVTFHHQMKQKTKEELQARLRQWHEHLKEFVRDSDVTEAYYANDVQVRVILNNLTSKLDRSPEVFDPAVHEEVGELDTRLSEIWLPGPFVWPLEWIPAYPEDPYWWLYGLPNALLANQLES